MGDQAARRSGGRRCMSRRIAVLKGGLSAEREVSLDSGYACAQALREKGYTVSEIDVSRDLGALVKALTPKPDAVFNALRSEEHTSEPQSLMRTSYAVFRLRKKPKEWRPPLHTKDRQCILRSPNG